MAINNFLDLNKYVLLKISPMKLKPNHKRTRLMNRYFQMRPYCLLTVAITRYRYFGSFNNLKGLYYEIMSNVFPM